MYYLGVKAYDSIKNNSKEILEKYSVNDKIEETFKLACLLHDVGHSPFSHSGENFLLMNQNHYMINWWILLIIVSFHQM